MVVQVASRGVSVADSMFVDEQDGFAEALADLRQARRHKRLQEIHWVDAFYKAYLSGLFGIIALVAISGAVGGGTVGAHALARALDRGPALLGVVSAVALGVGLRSGSRGGPIALERPDVRHVLMSPLARATALREPAVRQLRSALFGGIVVGAVAGLFAHRRLDHNAIVFVAAGALYGAVTTSLGISAALVSGGRRASKGVATGTAIVLVGWAVADAAGKVGSIHAPTYWVGRIALWPMKFDVWGVVPIVVAGLLAVAGLRLIEGLSIEAAERRTALVGQLRFAVTMQDLRTVLVLRRQLAMELPREHPWLGGGQRGRAHFPVWRRDWRGVMRWPVSRLIRLALLAGVAGFAMRAVWNGAVPLVVLAGLALWLASLDAVEAMAQETDHPSRRDAYPLERGVLSLRHTVVPAFVMVVVAAIAAGVGLLAGPVHGALAIAGIAIIPAALAAMAGAAVSVVMGAPAESSGGSDLFAFAPPEFAGMKTVMRAGWPPAVAIIGTLPLLAARSAHLHGSPAMPAELAASGGVLLVVVLALWWVRMQERVHDWWSTLMEESVAQQKARAEARKRDTGDDTNEDDS